MVKRNSKLKSRNSKLKTYKKVAIFFWIIAIGLLVAGFIGYPLNYIRAGIFVVAGLLVWWLGFWGKKV